MKVKKINVMWVWPSQGGDPFMTLQSLAPAPVEEHAHSISCWGEIVLWRVGETRFAQVLLSKEASIFLKHTRFSGEGKTPLAAFLALKQELLTKEESCGALIREVEYQIKEYQSPKS